MLLINTHLQFTVELCLIVISKDSLSRKKINVGSSISMHPVSALCVQTISSFDICHYLTSCQFAHGHAFAP